MLKGRELAFPSGDGRGRALPRRVHPPGALVNRPFLYRATTVVAASLAAVAAPTLIGAQQSDLTVSPFVTFLPTGGASPLAGLALTMAGNGGLALRASGHLSLENSNPGSLNGT